MRETFVNGIAGSLSSVRLADFVLCLHICLSVGRSSDSLLSSLSLASASVAVFPRATKMD